MSTLTLTFSLPEEKAEASFAMRAMDLWSALHDIDNRARSALKHDGDCVKALEEIRGVVREFVGGAE